MKTLWCKNQENPSDRISHAWAPLTGHGKNWTFGENLVKIYAFYREIFFFVSKIHAFVRLTAKNILFTDEEGNSGAFFESFLSTVNKFISILMLQIFQQMNF
jgi:hypothetical protein